MTTAIAEPLASSVIDRECECVAHYGLNAMPRSMSHRATRAAREKR